MTAEIDFTAMLDRVAAQHNLSSTEQGAAIRAMHYYCFRSEVSPWRGEMTERQRLIDEAVVSELCQTFGIGVSDAPDAVRCTFSTTRIEAARMRQVTGNSLNRVRQPRSRGKKNHRG